jgi:hypothetical protein
VHTDASGKDEKKERLRLDTHLFISSFSNTPAPTSISSSSSSSLNTFLPTYRPRSFPNSAQISALSVDADADPFAIVDEPCLRDPEDSDSDSEHEDEGERARFLPTVRVGSVVAYLSLDVELGWVVGRPADVGADVGVEVGGSLQGDLTLTLGPANGL